MHRTELLETGAGRLALGIVVLTAIVVAVGVAVLWPGDRAQGFRSTTVGSVEGAEVLAVDDACGEGAGCQRVAIEVTSDTAHRGERGSLVLSGVTAAPRIEPGDRLRVARLLPDDQSAQTDFAANRTYTFIDFERRLPLGLLAVAFAGLVVLLGRLHGLRALLGLGVSIVVLLVFVVPAIYAGERPVAVAIVGALGVMLATIVLSHGIGIKSAAAILGTTASLMLIAGLAVAAVGVAHLTGTSIGEASLLRSSGETLSLEGLVLAGMVIGALGVLDDVTVSQASTVIALHRTDPSLGLRRLVARALEVGRDHLGATVNTLALAYAGASLPLLLVFQARDAAIGDAINAEPVATAVAAAIVGSIGLLLAVPVTTLLAGILVRALAADQLPDEHAHVH
jgi:uncharacterized membrane protein